MEQFDLHAWKLRELRKYNNITSGRFEAIATAEERHTLTDGRVILTPEEGKWIGNPVTFEDGTLLPSGEYELVSGPRSNGGVLVVGKNGIIKEVREPAPDNGVRNSFAPMDRGRFNIEQYKREALSRHFEQGNKPDVIRNAIQNLEAKIAAIKKSIANPAAPKSFDFDTDIWHLKK